MESIRMELEAITGKLLSGPLTPVVYELLRDSPYKKDILEYVNYMTEEGRKLLDVCDENAGTIANEDFSDRPSIEVLLRRKARVVAVPRFQSSSE